MTMPRKGTRKITVTGVNYRYAIRPDGSTALMVTAELDAPEPGQVMQTRITLPPRSALDPEWVMEAIAKALAQGWNPAVKGPKFTGPAIDLTLPPQA